MRIAILADIHGNVTALDAVLADLHERGGADALVVAGDLCLDGPRPREALERVRALGCPVIQGNTDRDLAASDDRHFAEEYRQLLVWTREQLGDEGVAYLRGLPFGQRVEAPRPGAAVLVVHANPQDLDHHLRPLAPEEDLAPYLADVPDDVAVVAFGHLHIPYTRRVGRLLLADISSVGLPKDGDPRAGYGVLTWEGGEWRVEQRRVPYPLDEVVAQLRDANPPGVDELIHTLQRARYPNLAKARGERSARQRARPHSGTPRREEALDPAEPFGPAIRRLVDERTTRLLSFSDAVRAGETEAVHQMRVASRRLRAALDAALLTERPKRVKRLSRPVKALARALGAVRDRDVQLALLRPRLDAAPDTERPGLAALIARLEAERGAHHALLVTELDRWRMEGLTALQAWLAEDHEPAEHAASGEETDDEAR